MTKENESQEVFERRRERLEQLIKEIGSQRKLADVVGISETVISRMLYEPGKKYKRNIGEKSARKFEASLGKPYGWLDGVISNNSTTKNVDYESSHKAEIFGLLPFPSLSTRQYPLIDWGDVLLWSDNMKTDILQKETVWLPSVKDYGEDAYWLEVKDDTMSGSNGLNYPKGSIILVEPYINQQLTSGSKVIAHKKDGSASDLTFKFYYEDGGRKWLRAAMPGYPHLDGDDYEIVGLVVAAWIN
ncbi:LexA family protein [Klebsiella variicola]|uniref:LexA family protein n=1 Tax=Klebsiella variicola TaxID=244366 RepID=UPI0011EBE374|nr:S24 family peptidase [Klebsiella variicola]KAA0473379.1 hypothetical protein F0331_06255 [Klebsiella variicola]